MCSRTEAGQNRKSFDLPVEYAPLRHPNKAGADNKSSPARRMCELQGEAGQTGEHFGRAARMECASLLLLRLCLAAFESCEASSSISFSNYVAELCVHGVTFAGSSLFTTGTGYGKLQLVLAMCLSIFALWREFELHFVCILLFLGICCDL